MQTNFALIVTGKFQLRTLAVDDMITLLHDTIGRTFGDSEPVQMTMNTDKRFDNWIKNVWVFIFSYFAHAVTRFSHLPLIPCLTSGNWDDSTENQEVMLYNMNHTFLVKSVRDVEELPDKICDALERMSVKILPSLPRWLDIGRLPCIFTPNGPSIVRMFDQMSKYPQAAYMFNNSCTAVDAESVIELLAKVSTLPVTNAMMFLQRLTIFKQKASTYDTKTTLATVTACKRILSHAVCVPVCFVRPILVSDSHTCMSVAKELGANEINEDQIVCEILQEMSNASCYSIVEVHTFMLWILDNIRRFQSKNNIMSLIRNVCFVDNGESKLKPSELYDPRDSSLMTLFADERKFPINEFATGEHLNALVLLGLRTKGNLTADCLYMTAKHLDSLCRNGQSRASLEPKAKMLLQTLEERTDLLSSTLRATGSQLHMSIRQFLCIPQKKEKPHGYPEELSWKGSEFILCTASELKSIAFSEVAGSFIPLVRFNSVTLGQMFSWNARPDPVVLTQQLQHLVMNYRSTNKAGILPLIMSVYRAMMERMSDITSCPEFQNLLTGKCIWWGDGFCNPGQIVLDKRSEDIDVKPYMYTLPCELEPMLSFFLAVKCHQRQNIPVLLKVLELISERHKTKEVKDKNEVRKDLQLVLQILNRLFHENIKPEQYGDRLLFPIHTGDETTLVLEPTTRCTYCDAQWLKELTDEDDDDDEEILYVHADVPSRIAEGLGVKSLKTQLMSEAIGLEEWGQTEPLTTRLHNIVKEGYQDGLAVPKEIIQNADDARATTVKFIFDERENEDARTKLLDEGMASCQGPALWAYNDGLFSESDLKNITKLSGATKESDTSKIGKFGLGFCAVYNLTDVPSFVSGQNMVILDPHTKYLNKALPGKSPGLRINLKTMKNKRLMKKMHSQFKPFQNVLGCDLFQKDPYFKGTLFRLPLRTQQQAAVSEIKNTSYSREEVVKLLKQYVEACGNMLLFTQNVKELKLYHIPPSGVPPNNAPLICTVSKDIVSNTISGTILDICSEMKMKKTLHLNPFEIVQRVRIRIQNTEQMRMLSNVGETAYETNWLVSWATGVSKSLQLSCSTNISGALPLGSVAVLIKSEHDYVTPESMENCSFGFYKAGHLYCYLPLPIQSNAEFHVNGNFAVTSTRRGLQTNTEDDKYSYDTQWNEALLFDTIARSFINLLVRLPQLRTTNDYKFYQLWPTSLVSLTEPLRRGFYDSIVLSDHTVFESYGRRWLGITQCIFLNRNMSQDPDIAEAALSTLQKFRSDANKGVVNVPLTYMNELEKTVGWKEKANVVSEEEFFTKYFLPHVNETYWHESDYNVSCRDKLLLYCLRHSTPNIDALLTSIDCIPTDPDNELRKPPDLIYPEGRVANLFELEDGRFPEMKFRSHDILTKLQELGMMNDTLTSEMVIDRAMTVQSLESRGLPSQALERCHHLIAHLASSRNVDQQTLKKLGSKEFLPVLKKPSDWPFVWHADSLFGHKDMKGVCFEKAFSLFFDDCEKLVGCTKLVLDSSGLPYSLYDHQLFVQIGVNEAIDVKLQSAVEQLQAVCNEKDQKKDFFQKRVEEEVLDKLYAYMNRCAVDDVIAFQKEIKPLENENIILLESELLPVSKVAFSIGFNCIPELYEIGKNKVSNYKPFLQAVGVKEHIEVQDVVGILQRKRHQFDVQSLPSDELQLILQLLELLSSLMRNQQLRYQDIAHLGQENIVAPDMDMVLRPTFRLCLDDMKFKEASKSMRFVHIAVSRSVAESIGISTKKRKYVQDCSRGIPFEQKEELVTRLKGLLDGYPCDIGILKEMIQNADDANASEIHFIKDFRTHGCSAIFDNFEEFQGPSLLVFNDSPFSQADLEGLQNLGVGSKNADPAKTGQYGVGFNAVYNLTDLPSFLTKGTEIEGGETLCILDPLQKHCSEYCGMRYDVSDVRVAFSDVISGYCEEFFLGSKQCGTMFRFPLRQSDSDLGKPVTDEMMKKILDTLIADMRDILLFLRNIKKITISDISDGTLKHLHSVSVECNEDAIAQRSAFSVFCKERAKELKEAKSHASLSPTVQVRYRLTTTDNTRKQQEWIVVQWLGIDGCKVTAEVKKAINEGKLGMLPIGGVAVNIPETKRVSSILSALESYLHESRKIYCFLPLPIESGLPMHINGHFVLDHEARRSLWMEEEGYKSAWNNLVLLTTVAPSYIEALKCLKAILFDNDSDEYTTEQIKEKVKRFEQYFPIGTKAHGKYEKYLVTSIYETIINDKEDLFPVAMPIQETEANMNLENTRQSGQLLSHTDKRSQVKYQLVWTAFHPTGHQFPIYYTSVSDTTVSRTLDSIISRISVLGTTFNRTLVSDTTLSGSFDDLLKALGLKVTYLTTEVIETLVSSQCGISHVDANVMIQFLKSYSTMSCDRIKLGSLPCPVDKTEFVSVGNVKRVIRFCAEAETFKNELVGLPILVTNDGVLRCFDVNQTVYCSSICSLFQNSASKFVHNDLVITIKSLKAVVVKTDISMEELEEFLGLEFDRQVFTVSDMVEADSIPIALSSAWIECLWEFIIGRYQAANTGQNKISFDVFIRPLQNWCILPAVKGDGTRVLIKISKMDIVLNMESFSSNPSLETVINKLQLPSIDRNSLPEEASKELEKHLASANTPVTLLVCLKSYKERFRNTHLTENDCFAVLNFFSDNLSVMQKTTQMWWIIQAMKALPVFLTHNGHCLSVENENVKVLVLPLGMPKNGIPEWADSTGKILLKENLSLKAMYTFLEFSFTGIIQIYTEELLRSWEHVPQNSVLEHLEYIRDHLLTKGVGQKYNEHQAKLIHMLTVVPVILVDNARKKASDFFCPDNEIFKLFCCDDEFPPVQFREEIWEKLLKLIGIKINVTDTQFMEFAKQVSREGYHKLAESTKAKSTALVTFLMQNELKWNADVYAQISCIRFIVPYTTQARYVEVHKQSTENQNLICLKDSISFRYEELTWTSLPLLPPTADPYSYPVVNEAEFAVAQKKEVTFRIHHKPTLDSVVLHCQNVCDSLKVCLTNRKMRDRVCKWIDSFMEHMYNYLQQHGRNDETTRSRLYHTPVIFLPDRQTVVPAHQTVITIMPEQEIAPYLVQTPTRYGKFSSLFTYLGAAERPNYMLYVNVLADIKRDIGDKTLEKEYLPEWLAISSAVDNLMKQVGDDIAVNNPPTNTVLYLPTRDKMLLDSSSVIVSDNTLQELRVSGATTLQYFIGFKQLGIRHETMDIRRLPKQIRPKRLTQITREEIDTEEMQEVEGCEEAIQLERFFQSPHFIEGVLRLLKHAKTRSADTFKTKEEAIILSELQNVQVRCVTGLKTFIYVNNKRIDKSAIAKRCYFDFHDERWWIYFQKAVGSQAGWLRTIDDCLVRFITRITGKTLRDNVIETYGLIQMRNSVTEISLMLDSLNIDAYDLPRDMYFTVIPPAGTYVPIELHHLLNCEISVFGIHEYRCVAFELEDRLLLDNIDVSDSYNPVYIYVKIIKKLPSEDPGSVLTDRYMIFTGDEYITVSSSQLYKLIRATSDAVSNELVSAEGGSSSVSPDTMNKEKYTIRFHLMEAWKLPEQTDRKRVIGRLLRRYHPDKNPGNEAMCNELFAYLRDCISRLENGTSLENEDETDGRSQQNRAYPDFTDSAYFGFVQRMSNRSERQGAHVRDYYRADQPYNRSTGSNFRNPHSDSNTKECHDPWEARRWYSQAKVDLRNAIDTIDTPGEEGDPPAFNWICYMCHQVTNLECLMIIKGHFCQFYIKILIVGHR